MHERARPPFAVEPGEALISLFAGAFFAAVAIGAWSGPAAVAALAEREPAAFPSRDRPFDVLSARELRRLPGLGPARARSIADARWELALAGGPRAFDRVPGIGPETIRKIEEWLARHPPPATSALDAQLEHPRRGAYTSNGNTP